MAVLAQVTSPLDPLLASLAHFSSSKVATLSLLSNPSRTGGDSECTPIDRQDLSHKIQELFHLLDQEGNGTLNYVEMQVPDALHV